MGTEAAQAPHVVPRMKPEDLAKFVEDFCHNRYAVSASIPPDMWELVFMPISLGAFKDWTEEELKQIGVLYEDYDKAGQRSVNGWPSFFSFQCMHVDDWKVARERIIVAQEAVKKAAEGA